MIDLSGVSAMIWLEGINDFSRNSNAAVETVISGMKDVVGRIRAKRPDLRVFGATVLTALGSSNAAHGFIEQDEKRQALNDFIRKGGLFDGVVDFDQVTFDPHSGGLKPEFVPESTTGGPGDKLIPIAPVTSRWGWRSTWICSSPGGNVQKASHTAFHSNVVMAGLVPASPLTWHGRATMIGVAGTSPAMTRLGRSSQNPARESPIDAAERHQRIVGERGAVGAVVARRRRGRRRTAR